MSIPHLGEEDSAPVRYGAARKTETAMADDAKILDIAWPPGSNNWLVLDCRDPGDISVHVGEEDPAFRKKDGSPGPVDARIGLLMEQAMAMRDFLNRVLPE